MTTDVCPTSLCWQYMESVSAKHRFKILSKGSIFAINDECNEVSEYLFNTSTWMKHKIEPLPNDVAKNSILSATYNPNTNTIYLFITKTETASIAKLKMSTSNHEQQNKWQILDGIYDRKEMRRVLGQSSSQIIFINGECHIIGGNVRNHHLKYDDKSQRITALHDLSKKRMGNSLKFFGLIKVGTKVLLFGGFDRFLGGNNFDQVCEYDIISNVWNKLDVKMPNELCGFGCTTVLNGEYILIFGGEYLDYTPEKSDDIWIYSVRNKTFTKSKVTCPKEGCFTAIARNNIEKRQLMTFGFIRREWRECRINDHLFPPQNLLRIMSTYYLVEDVHLFHGYNCSDHYKISVFDIFKQ